MRKGWLGQQQEGSKACLSSTSYGDVTGVARMFIAAVSYSTADERRSKKKA